MSHLSEDEEIDDNHRVVETDPSGRFVRYKTSLGNGACKEVFKAFDEEEGKEVAWYRLRLERLSKRDIHRVVSEISILRSLRNENIINLLHFWTSRGNDDRERVYFITELMTSGTLKSYVRKLKGPVKPKVLKNWCRQILSGLEYLHSRNPPVIHRDLKGDNIFVNGNNGQAKIGDLGLATMMKTDRLSSVLGTPEFMAPELYDESYDEKVDIYAFGMVVIEIVTKEYPYSECQNQAQIYKKVTAGVKPAAFHKVVDESTKNFIEQCIRFDPTERPSASQLLRSDFLKCLDENSRSEVSLYDASSQARETRSSIDEQPDLNGVRHKSSLSAYDAVVVEVIERMSEDQVKLKVLYMPHPNAPVQEIKFPFHCREDTAANVVREMVRERVIDPRDEDLARRKLELVIGGVRPIKLMSPNPSLERKYGRIGGLRSEALAHQSFIPSVTRAESDQRVGFDVDGKASPEPAIGLLASSPQSSARQLSAYYDRMRFGDDAPVHQRSNSLSAYDAWSLQHATSQTPSHTKRASISSISSMASYPDSTAGSRLTHVPSFSGTLPRPAGQPDPHWDDIPFEFSPPDLQSYSSRHATTSLTPIFAEIPMLDASGTPPSLSLPSSWSPSLYSPANYRSLPRSPLSPEFVGRPRPEGISEHDLVQIKPLNVPLPAECLQFSSNGSKVPANRPSGDCLRPPPFRSGPGPIISISSDSSPTTKFTENPESSTPNSASTCGGFPISDKSNGEAPGATHIAPLNTGMRIKSERSGSQSYSPLSPLTASTSPCAGVGAFPSKTSSLGLDGFSLQ